MEPYDNFGRFVLGAEQLNVCRELLLGDSTPKHRMAVILLDSLVDALLYRIMEEAFLYSDRAWFGHLLPFYSTRKREKARAYFAERLKIARDPSYATAAAGYPAIITETDITVLAIGHSYRNAAYHRDTHNPAVLATIGKKFFESASQLLISAQHPGLGQSVTKGQADRLRSIGIDLNSGQSRHGTLYYRDAAEKLASILMNGMDVPIHELAEELAEDLDFRVQEVREGIDILREVPGDISEHLEWIEFSESHDKDDDLTRLKDVRDAIIHHHKRLEIGQITSAMRAEEVEAANAYSKRFWELWQTRDANTKGGILRSLTDIEKVGRRFLKKRSSATILQEYHRADEALSTIERNITEAVIAYESRVP